jgi:hypothetical protein
MNIGLQAKKLSRKREIEKTDKAIAKLDTINKMLIKLYV